MNYDADLDLILGDTGYTVNIDGTTVPCDFMDSDQVVGQSAESAGQVVGVASVLVRASALPSIATGSAVTVTDDAGTDTQYAAARCQAIQDGKVLQIFLGAADGDF